MKNRKIPYGYKIEDGKIAICHEEAPIVKELFEKRAAGRTLKEIADSLNLRNIPYYPGIGWDKHKVKRVLENDRYLGTDGFPLMLDRETVTAARAFQYYTEVNRTCHPSVHLLKSKIICADCGKKMVRKCERNRRQPTGWRCQACGAVLFLPDDALLDAILQAHKSLKDGLLDKKSGGPFSIPSSPAVKLLEDRIRRQLAHQDRDIAETLALIQEWAMEKYETCKNETDGHTDWLAVILETCSLAEYDDALSERIISNIILSQTGAIMVRYINGMEITAGRRNEHEQNGA